MSSESSTAPITPEEAAAYLRTYVQAYRTEYARFTSPPPEGGGYPPIRISPYLDADVLHCYLATDGAAVLHFGDEPREQWWIAGGPAFLADFEQTREPAHVTELLAPARAARTPLGLYRIVVPGGIPDEIWEGRLPTTLGAASARVGQTMIEVRSIDATRNELLKRLTFGVLGLALNLNLPDATSEFWRPHVVRRAGFATADRRARRFINYLELLGHIELPAWDARAIPARLRSDIRRDFAMTLGSAGPGASISLGAEQDAITGFFDRLAALSEVVERFRKLLEQADQTEEAYHEFLKANPILLDVYGEAVSKPRFIYPAGESPLGKAYVEPDFVIKLPGRSYRLVELERPSKRVSTIQGQPRAEFTQAVFQIAEWKAFITNHYDTIKDDFPGIGFSHSAMVVIGRNHTLANEHSRDSAKYRELLRTQYPQVDFLTYDDLVERARVALVRLSALGA